MRISLFTAASDTFAVKNSGLPFEKSLERSTSIVPRAKMKGLAVRAYLSCAFGCPFEGDDPLERAPLMTRRLLDIGCDEVVPSDTTSVGTERKIHAFAILGLLKASSNDLAVFKKIALHLHGDDLDRVGAGLLWGIARYDASLGRVGGCPATTQSKHNLNVMDLLNYLKKQGYVTGIDLEKVRQAERYSMKYCVKALKDCLCSLEKALPGVRQRPSSGKSVSTNASLIPLRSSSRSAA